jgi:hypothetical protein
MGAQEPRTLLHGASGNLAVFAALGGSAVLLASCKDWQGQLVATHLLAAVKDSQMLRDAVVLNISPLVASRLLRIGPDSGHNEELLVGLQWCGPLLGPSSGLTLISAIGVSSMCIKHSSTMKGAGVACALRVHAFPFACVT